MNKLVNEWMVRELLEILCSLALESGRLDGGNVCTYPSAPSAGCNTATMVDVPVAHGWLFLLRS